MEKDFAELFAEEEAKIVSEPEKVEEASEDIDESKDEDVVDDVEETTEEKETEEESESDDNGEDGLAEEEEKSVDDKSKKAFNAAAEMRVKLKKAEEEKDKMKTSMSDIESKLKKFEEISKKLGFEDVDAMLSKTEKRLIEQEAESSGRTVEEVQKEIDREKRIRDLEDKISKAESDKKEEVFSNTILGFYNDNKLSPSDTEEIDKKLSEDGLTLDDLKGMQPKPLKRLLESYLPKKIDKQKELEEKVKVKKTVPLDQTSGTAEAVDEEVDKLYKELTKEKSW